MNVSLPATLKKYVERRVKAGEYSTPSEYMRELIRTDRDAQEQKNALEGLLREGISGSRIKVTPAFWENVRKETVARIQQKRTGSVRKRTA